MTTILLVIHLFLAIALVVTILLQRSEGGALGIGGGGGGGGMMQSRGQANLLTRTTAVLATLFIITSMTLAILASQGNAPRSVLDAAPAVPEQQPAPGQAPPAGDASPSGAPDRQPAPEPSQPAAPLGR